jgi:uncharacterized protein
MVKARCPVFGQETRRFPGAAARSGWMTGDWRANLIETDDALRALLRETKRIAVLGIKPEGKADAPAHFVPRYAQSAGYEVIPVPVYYPDVTEILGRPVYRRVAEIPGRIDMVNVFRRPADIPPHLDDLVAARPRSVWFQLGIRHDEAARTLAEAGIRVVQDRCLSVEHERLLGSA